MAWTRINRDNGTNQTAAQRLAEALTAAVAFGTETGSLRALAVRHLRELTQCDAVVFCAYQPAARGYVPVCSDGEDLTSWADASLAEGGSLIRWLRVNEEILRLPDQRGAETFLDDAERRLLEQHSVRACLPLLALSQLVGIALFVSRHPDARMSQDDARLLTACGPHVAVACEAVGRHDAEMERLRSAGRAQQLAVAGQLAASVAHEVRNPLTAIRSTLQFVLNSTQPWSETRWLVADLVSEVDRIERTISGILTLSRPTDLVEESVDLCDVIDESMRLVRAYAEGQNVSIRIPTDPGTLPVVGDPIELRKVFVNLLFNACQAMPSGGVITIRHQIIPQTDGGTSGGRLAALVEVQDTGEGMTDDVVKKVFDPFFTTKSGGTGLGLPICLEIINRHRGEIRLSSEAGHGTLVSIRLPLREVA